MIATRFRSVGWVAMVAASALGCYLVSQRVASERAHLAQVENRILDARRDIRQLQTEISTRGRMGQLERWNGDVLALSAPNARQFVASEVQLASITQAPLPLDPKIVADHGAIERVAYEKPVAKPAPAEAVAAVADQPLLRQATYIKPKGEAMAPTRVALLDSSLLGAINRAAASERSGQEKRTR